MRPFALDAVAGDAAYDRELLAKVGDLVRSCKLPERVKLVSRWLQAVRRRAKDGPSSSEKIG
jgi:hypothetical protein